MAERKLTPRTKLGGYTVGDLLGHGGSGSVYQASRDADGKLVAIKVVAVGDDSRKRERIRVEFRTLASLKHPGIVEVHESGEEADFLWYSMEYVQGPSLKILLGDAGHGKLPMAENALLIAQVGFWAQVLEAVEYLHQHGVVHGDIKPENILVDSTGNARLVDFGVTVSPFQTVTPEVGALVGTLWYWSPEYARYLLKPQDVPYVKKPTDDMYAMGVILYQILTGRRPFVTRPDVDSPVARIDFLKRVAVGGPVAPCCRSSRCPC
jgi:serine/threonine-protein kinase